MRRARRETGRELFAYPAVILIAAAIAAVLVGLWLGGWEAALVTVGVAVALIAVIVALSSTRRERLGEPPQSSPVEDGIHRVLVVADERSARSDLAEKVRARADGRPLSLFVVAPALESHFGRLTDDQRGYDAASGRLKEIVDGLHSDGIDARGEVGSTDPLQAADDGLRQFPADEIVFVTHPESKANWLETGVVEKAKARYPQPVEHVQALA